MNVLEMSMSDCDVSKPAEVFTTGEFGPIGQRGRDPVMVRRDMGCAVWRVVGATNPDLLFSDADEVRCVLLEQDALDLDDFRPGDGAVSLHGIAQRFDVGGDGLGV